MENETRDILTGFLLIALSVIVILWVSANSVPDDEVMERWAEYQPAEAEQFEADHNWYILSIN